MDDPKPTFLYLVSQFVSRFPDLAFIDLVEPNFLSNPAPEPSAASRYMSSQNTTNAHQCFGSNNHRITSFSDLSGPLDHSSAPVATHVSRP